MNFSDTDLKRLKEDMDRLGDYPIGNYRMRPLLARLEASENPKRQQSHDIIPASLDCEDPIHLSDCERCEADREWRKVSGK